MFLKFNLKNHLTGWMKWSSGPCMACRPEVLNPFCWQSILDLCLCEGWGAGVCKGMEHSGKFPLNLSKMEAHNDCLIAEEGKG